MNLEVMVASGDNLSEPLGLLETSLREGEPLPESFTRKLDAEISAGNLEILAAREVDCVPSRVVGVAVVSYRLSVSAADGFASVEDLYVVPETRRTGVGRALLDAVKESCLTKGISYVEVQVVDEEARGFYAAAGYELEEGVAVLSRSYALGGSSSETS